MRVFISWSGSRSNSLATFLEQWIPRVIQVVEPWVSSASIDPGTRWSDEVSRALEDLQFGILCLTPENLTSPWILFEAGALSKIVLKSHVVPYLFGFEPGLTHHNSESGLAGKPCLLVKSKLLDHIFATFRQCIGEYSAL